MTNLKDKTDTQLQKEKRAVYAEIQRREWKLKNEENSALVGQCFRYWNGYNSEDRWWLYVKVLKVESGGLRVFSFEQDTHGKIAIETNQFHSSLSGSYESISNLSFLKHWNEMSEKIQKFAVKKLGF